MLCELFKEILFRTQGGYSFTWTGCLLNYNAHAPYFVQYISIKGDILHNTEWNKFFFLQYAFLTW